MVGGEGYRRWRFSSKRTHLTRPGTLLSCLYPQSIHEAWLRVVRQPLCVALGSMAVEVGCSSRSLAFFLEKKSKERDLEVGLFFHFPVLVTPLFLTPIHRRKHWFQGHFGVRVLKRYPHFALVAFLHRQQEARVFF